MKAVFSPSSWSQNDKNSRTRQVYPSHQEQPYASLPPSSFNQLRSPSSALSPSTTTKNNLGRAPSFSSLNSAYSQNAVTSHPYAAMVPPPLPVVSSRDAIEDEDECPVCLEPLSFSFRLPGEKPHIIPECGHALHEACFTAVYGPSPSQQRAGSLPRKVNLGVCGVCRRPMKVGEGDSSGKSNKLAALTGMGERNTPALYPGRETPSMTNRSQPSPGPRYDPSQDDPLDHTGSVRSGGAGANDHSAYIVAPSIQVRPEFSSLTRSNDPAQPLTSIVIIELPGRRNLGHVPPPVMPPPFVSRNGSLNGHGLERERTMSSSHSSPMPDQGMLRNSDISESTLRSRMQSHSQRGSSPSNDGYPSNSVNGDRDLPPYTSPRASEQQESPFSAITEDLRNRIIDWKGHPLSGLGTLQMFDLLSVRRDALVREFFVYLFKEAIICVVEEKKRTLTRFLPGAEGAGGGSSSSASSSASQKGVLRLRGRIYIRHIKQVTDTSVSGEMSLTIDMEDERLESFILIFKDRSSLDSWKANIQGLVTIFHQNNPSQSQQQQQQQQQNLKSPDLEEFGGSAKAARMLSGSSTTPSTVDSLLRDGSGRSTMSSSTSNGSHMMSRGGGMTQKLSTLGEDEELDYDQSPTGLVTPHVASGGPSNSLTPLQHPPMDLILVVSLPPPSAVPSTAALKARVIKTTLDFIMTSLSSKDRLSLVTFEVGIGGRVRKTPFLSCGRAQGRDRLMKFIDEIGVRRDEGIQYEDEFLVRGSKDEKTDVVTAVNHGLDVVLQRKARNPISGMLLVSDAADSTRRAQMDLVLARAEAANVPIHSFGYGRSHDPASLWLMSNHTSGTYTFVKDWYDLRDCLAGCIGGMMSIGLLNMKLHMKIVDGHRFRIRKVSGGPSSIVSSDGRNVDVELGELRYGERKEMLVELELDNTEMAMNGNMGGPGGSRALNATDQFVQRMGLDSLSLGDSGEFADGMMNRMIDEVPVFEVDGSFFDPAAAKHISRLAHPVLLTVTLLPANGNRPRSPVPGSDPVIVRRRMELLASDMITRSLVLVSRKNYPQAQKIMSETKRILHTVLQSITQSLPPPSSNGSTVRNRKELLTLSVVRALQAILQDMQVLSEALDENVELFAHDQRNFGAQQAMILRDQKSWTGRTATEKLFWTTDNSIELVSRSTDWVARE